MEHLRPAPPLLRAALLAEGFSHEEIRTLRRRHHVSVRPGAYVRADDARLRSPEARHALAVEAAVRQLAPGVVSHVSAAVLHGIAIWAVPLDRVHLTRSGQPGGQRTRHLHVHGGPLHPDDVVRIGGVEVTSAARTIVDLARTVPFEQAVVAADSALSRGAVTPAELDEALERAGHRHGVAAAGRVVRFADGRAESPGESRSRVAIHHAGLPAPDLQVEVRTADGRVLGRADFGWDGVVGEFDGRVKYGRLLRPGQHPGDVVYAEKRREESFRAVGKQVVRWGWADLDDFTETRTRLAAALGT